MKKSVVGLLAAAAAAAMAVPAQADTGALIHGLSVDTSGHLSFALTAPALPDGAGLDPSTTRVLVDGHRVPTTATATATREVAGTPATAMLVVDTSGSMKGRGIVAARAAARQFLQAAPSTVQVGLETFSDRPVLLVAPTIDRRRVLAALRDLRPQGETALYDALVAAADAAGKDGRRRLVVISDGADTVSGRTLAAAVAAVNARRTTVEVVGLHTAEADNAVLRRVASDTGGRFVLAGNGAALAAALRSSARSYAVGLAVQADVPTELWGEDRRVTVSVDSSAGPVTRSTHLSIGIGSFAQPVPAHASASDTKRLLWAGLLAIALALLLGAFALFGGDSGAKRRVRQMVGRYSMTPETESKAELSAIGRTALDLADRVAHSRGLNDRLTMRLTRAGVSFTASEWLLLQVGIVFATALLFVLLGMSPIVAAVAGLVVGPLLGHAFLGILAARRKAAFVALLPDTLQLIAGTLSAGYSLGQSLDGVVAEGSQPVAGEFGRALAESRLGVPIERTLEGIADRMDSEDFRWVVLAIQIQHQVGGNLAEVLLTVAGTMRERVQLHRHVRALSAEGRLSAYILIALPLVFALYLFTSRREYIHLLYTTKMGLAMIALGSTLMVIGSVVMKKMVTVEV
jgi:Flp pilus assembly protein TadB/Mg-chelatase subunit ChlD